MRFKPSVITIIPAMAEFVKVSSRKHTPKINVVIGIKKRIIDTFDAPTDAKSLKNNIVPNTVINSTNAIKAKTMSSERVIVVGFSSIKTTGSKMTLEQSIIQAELVVAEAFLNLFPQILAKE